MAATSLHTGLAEGVYCACLPAIQGTRCQGLALGVLNCLAQSRAHAASGWRLQPLVAGICLFLRLLVPKRKPVALGMPLCC